MVLAVGVDVAGGGAAGGGAAGGGGTAGGTTVGGFGTAAGFVAGRGGTAAGGAGIAAGLGGTAGGGAGIAAGVGGTAVGALGAAAGRGGTAAGGAGIAAGLGGTAVGAVGTAAFGVPSRGLPPRCRWDLAGVSLGGKLGSLGSRGIAFSVFSDEACGVFLGAFPPCVPAGCCSCLDGMAGMLGGGLITFEACFGNAFLPFFSLVVCTLVLAGSADFVRLANEGVCFGGDVGLAGGGGMEAILGGTASLLSAPCFATDGTGVRMLVCCGSVGLAALSDGFDSLGFSKSSWFRDSLPGSCVEEVLTLVPEVGGACPSNMFNRCRKVLPGPCCGFSGLSFDSPFSSAKIAFAAALGCKVRVLSNLTAFSVPVLSSSQRSSSSKSGIL